MTYRELVYMVLDRIKGQSDDFSYTEEHVIFIANKYRSYLLKNTYKDIKKTIPQSNYQTICLDLEQANVIDGRPCSGDLYLRSKDKIPTLIEDIGATVYPTDYFQGINIIFTTRDRLRYVGENRYMKNLIYTAIGADKHLYFKSNNPQHLQLGKVRMSGVFEDAEKANELSCDENGNKCNILDMNFPLESDMVMQLCDAIVQVLLNAKVQPQDAMNNANDDMAAIMNYLRNNVKSNLQKQIDGD